MREHNIPTDTLESGRRKVLIVDDDPAIVDLLTDVLQETKRFECRAVNNGFAAGKMANEYHPDLIILDIMLPDINGKVVCETLRKDPNLTEIKIICISGMVEEDKIDELKAAGANGFMHKPLNIDTLKLEIAKLLDMSEDVMAL